jgi:hypothetical protein
VTPCEPAAATWRGVRYYRAAYLGSPSAEALCGAIGLVRDDAKPQVTPRFPRLIRAKTVFSSIRSRRFSRSTALVHGYPDANRHSLTKERIEQVNAGLATLGL